MNNTQFDVQVKIGILNTIAKSIYSDPKVKIREAVSNSIDKKASFFIIYADRGTRTLSLFDNGTGISNMEFEEIFKSIGYGIFREDYRFNSYFGLGLMSVLALGQKAIILTKSNNEKKMLKLEVDTFNIFSDKMQNEPITKIKDFLIPNEIFDIKERDKYSILSFDDIRLILEQFPNTFTEILLHDIPKNIFERIISKDFEDELRKILPLPIIENEPFFECIKDNDAKEWLINIHKNKDFCPTINLFFGISENEKDLTQLWKYYPQFKSVNEFSKSDIHTEIVNYGNSKKYAMYFLYSIGDLEELTKEKSETGFWVRNKNFLVKEADYFHKAGTKKKIIHEPLKKWIFGEIFHQDMTDCLVVTRDEYVWDSNEFKQFYESVDGRLCDISKELRDAYKKNNEIIESIVKPFQSITTPNNPFERVLSTIQKLEIIDNVEQTSEIFEKFEKERKIKLEDDKKRIDQLLSTSKKNIQLINDKINNIKVIIDPSVSPQKMVEKQRIKGTNKILFKISPKLFNPQKVNFLGETFNIYYVIGDELDSGISINRKEHKIYINPFNHDVLYYSVSFIDVYIVIEIADYFSENKKEMKKFIIALLGDKLSTQGCIPQKYLYSLRDDLSRRID